MESIEGMTPKERYDAQMVGIAVEKEDAIARAKGKNPDEERELNEVTEEANRILKNMEKDEGTVAVDKNMGNDKQTIGPLSVTTDEDTGEQSISCSREQFETMKEQKAAERSLLALKNAQVHHLSHSDQRIMTTLVSDINDGLVSDGILQHLLNKKAELNKNYAQSGKKIQDLNRRMLNEIAVLTNDLVKTTGAVEHTDRMILDRHKELSKELEGEEKI